MASRIPEITQLLIASAEADLVARSYPVSIGVALDGGQVFWGDCLLTSDTLEPLPVVHHLVDLSTTMLRGQRPARFRDLCESLYPVFPTTGLDSAADAVADPVRGAIQQALLAAVSNVQQVSTVDVLSTEYEMPAVEESPMRVPLFLEISDFAATPERIEHMLNLRPAGIGYRLTGNRIVEAIGESGEHLQRFVREIGKRSEQLAVAQEDSRPAIYLGLNGALGQLAGDPVQHTGKILGHCVGLQNAAGSRPLLLENPILLKDPLAQSANLLKLKDFLHRTDNSQKRVALTRLAARADALSEEIIGIYADVQSAHALVFDPLFGDINRLMSRFKTLRNAGIELFLTLRSSAGRTPSPRWAITAADMAMAGRAAGLLVSFDDGNDLHRIVARRLSEVKAWPGAT